MKKEEQEIKKTTEELLASLGVTGDVVVEKTDDVVNVTLDTQDTGMVIGHHGDILESLQLVLSMCISKKIGSFVRVSLEVGDYKKNRTSWVETMAVQAKERALAQGQEIPLPNLKAWERRIVHLMFQDDKEVVSESVGEGKERTLVVKPR